MLWQDGAMCALLTVGTGVFGVPPVHLGDSDRR